jgi:hypothetical protein
VRLPVQSAAPSCSAAERAFNHHTMQSIILAVAASLRHCYSNVANPGADDRLKVDDYDTQCSAAHSSATSQIR